MSLDKRWRRALISILEHLTDSDLSKMLYNLDNIPQGLKTTKAKEEIPFLMEKYYGTEKSISEIDRIMKIIPRNDADVQNLLRPFVEKLKEQRQEGKMSELAADSGSVANKWETALSSILEELTDQQFAKMLFYLDEIPQGLKKDKAREEIPDLIVQQYGPEGSISEIDEIMKAIPRNDPKVQNLLRPFVEKLKEQRQEEKGPSGATQQRNVPAEDNVPAEKKLLKVRAEFIERVSDPVLNQLLDNLLEHGFINDQEMQSVTTKKSRADKAREVIDTVRKKGTKASSLLINTLCKVDKPVAEVLKLI
ncbi:uncharacterized protein LOC114566870 isoform X2 [Perca flavescens]|uniref:uncharacterized protein LOC114566870 isoform X2 n=1 Tax=Perca flavescens TaxID=8167 RepID=UPI00106EFA8F|nr:uncharacterized protein LOC114566870 isoform X2 [Perca flavescens]